MNIQSFIFIHDKDILIKYIEASKFKKLPNLKYVFVGNNPKKNVMLPNILKHFQLNTHKTQDFTTDFDYELSGLLSKPN